tara:strand:- start:152 stop:661 length:510 start_codon:yes stop_codon:yes gene_type:complete
MVELVTGVTLAARVAFFIASYRGHKAESHKEDDRAVRTWIMESLNNIRENVTNIMTSAYRNNKPNLERDAKDIISAIDNFKNEVNVAVTGNIQPRLSKKSSADLESLVEFDLKIIEELNSISKESSISSENSDSKHLSPRNLSGIRKELTSCRNYFRERTKFIGGIKNV